MEAVRAGSHFYQALNLQIETCSRLGSPFTARLLFLVKERLTDETAVAHRLFTWPGDISSGGAALFLRLAGCLHALVLEGRASYLAEVYPPNDVTDDALWAAVMRAFCDEEAFFLDRLKSPPQTNEIYRNAALLPGFLTIVAETELPFVILEPGASAGLNMIWDKYRYDLGGLKWGPDDAPILIKPQWKGPVPAYRDIAVQSRAGCDLSPFQPDNVHDRLRLLSYIWPDQSDRLKRTRQALDLAAKREERVEHADAVAWLESRLARQQPDAVHVVYHSIFFQYLSEEQQARMSAVLEEAGKRATASSPLAWLQMERDTERRAADITLNLWPGGRTRLLGKVDFHGRWVDWRA